MDEPQDDSDEHAPASALIALPPDALARVCAYLETRPARRLHASGQGLRPGPRQRGLGRGHQNEPRRPQAPAQGVGRSQGPRGPPKLHRRARSARMRSDVRRHTNPGAGWGLPGFHGLATDGGVDEGDATYWCDALFRPEVCCVEIKCSMAQAIDATLP